MIPQEIDPGQEAKKIISGPDSLPGDLPYLLHKITCVVSPLNCLLIYYY